MITLELIQKKRDGIELTKDEIDFLLTEYQSGNMPDYQMSAFLMATFFKDMTDQELSNFTIRMRDSGEHIKFDNINKYLVDKHSTGGVGDKVTIILAPILASLGLATAKLSGKGLGHTGGTIDKFESIEGFKFSKNSNELSEIANKTGIGLMGYSDKIVPLDKKIYALRDVTATVASIPLIASSIMSKKLATQSDLIILDVKVGDGAFMKDIKSAKILANRMINIGKSAKRNVIVVLTNMDEPLGKNIGNALEVLESIEALKGNFESDVKEVVYTFAAISLVQSKKVKDFKEAYIKIDEVINSGKALETFKNFLKLSEGDTKILEDYKFLNIAKNEYDILSKNEGYIEKIYTEEIGRAAMVIGAGRETKDSKLDYGVGIIIEKKVGDFVKKGEVLAKIIYNSDNKLEDSKMHLKNAFKINKNKIDKLNTIIEIIE